MFNFDKSKSGTSTTLELLRATAPQMVRAEHAISGEDQNHGALSAWLAPGPSS